MLTCIHITRYDLGLAPQRGSALIIALVFLLAMTLIGVTAMQGTNQQESMAGNMRNHNLAFQAAEAALRAGERVLAAAAPPNNFNDATGNGYIALRNPGADVGAFWMGFNWAALSQSIPNNTLGSISQQPSYVIEEDSAGGSIPPCPVAGGGVRCFRITARGLGGTADAVAILQATYAR